MSQASDSRGASDSRTRRVGGRQTCTKGKSAGKTKPAKQMGFAVGGPQGSVSHQYRWMSRKLRFCITCVVPGGVNNAHFLSRFAKQHSNMVECCAGMLNKIVRTRRRRLTSLVRLEHRISDQSSFGSGAGGIAIRSSVRMRPTTTFLTTRAGMTMGVHTVHQECEQE